MPALAFTLAASLAAVALQDAPASAPVAAAPAPPPISRVVNDGGGVLVLRGQRAVVRVAADGKLTLVSASIIDPASVVTPAIQNGAKAAPQLAEALRVTAEPGTLALSLGGTPQAGSLLKVESGLDRQVGYRAQIVRVSNGAAKASPTSVCSLLPHVVGVEHWPEYIAAVVAAGFADQSGPPVCR